MPVITGKSGHIAKDSTVISCVRQWGINHTSELQTFGCSATKGARGRIGGTEDWSGQYQAYGAIPAVLPGDVVEFNGAISGEGATAVGVSGDVMIDSIEITWNVETGAPIAHTVQFSGNGALTKGTVNVPADTGIPDPLTAKGCKVEIWTVEAVPVKESEFAELRTITLRLSKENQAFATTTTAGWKMRAEGPLDIECSFTVLTDDFADFPAVNSIKELRLYIDATHYWQLKWMIFGEQSGLDVDIEGGALVGGTVNAAFVPYTPVAGTPTQGVVKDPSDTPVTIWPEA